VRKPAALAVLLALIVALGGGVSVWYYLFRDNPERAAGAYLDAWQKSDYSAMRQLVLNPRKEFSAVNRQAFKSLPIASRSFDLGEISADGGSAIAPFTARLRLRSLGDWTYTGRLDLKRRGGNWFIDWSPAAIHPDFKREASFGSSRTWPERGKILAVDGRPIAETRRAVVVGVVPRRMNDRSVLVQALVTNLGSDPARINSLLNQAMRRPDSFTPIEELTVERYEAAKPAIYPVPGLVFQNQQMRMPPGPGFAQHVLGKVEEATAEALERLGEPYQKGDLIGLSGMEAAFERRLAGRPSGEVFLSDAEGKQTRVVQRFAGQRPESVQTTIDIDVQKKAESALEGVAGPAAIVVVDAQTSQVRAAVSRPLAGFNRAFTGRYPPGSSFKIVTAGALLNNGVSVDQMVDCPSETKVGGKTFRNFEGKALGDIPFAEAFAESCNSAFVKLASSLERDKLTAAAGSFGFGRKYSFPLNVAGGSFPEPHDATDQAASAIGQGRVEASPVHMATVAAAVANSGWHSPGLVVGDDSGMAEGLDPGVAQTLQSLMKSVVSEGTGVRARVPGKEVAGKTGTAEFGTRRPPATHAWFVGYSGPLAFAVLVEGGGVGGEVAAPIAARLMAGL
jgi:cell division protein FtsI/penicillin-binding protein 2